MWVHFLLKLHDSQAVRDHFQAQPLGSKQIYAHRATKASLPDM